MRYALVILGGVLTASVAFADSGSKAPPNPLFQQECGSCHVPYPPRLLDESSWRKLMDGLDKHFGSDASLDAISRSAIEAHVLANASRRERLGVDGKPTLRITQTAWYQRKHDEIGSAVWRRPSIKTAANCAACHREAEQGIFNEHQVRIPK
ncbi:diheme cytochrome c [Uliginosibacterium flavum]|uniref:Cytochrome C n=1 Tax=Uliginosibacterium flavum TaxID=1396831 RepID=A0ABV2THX1_9RHOO